MGQRQRNCYAPLCRVPQLLGLGRRLTNLYKSVAPLDDSLSMAGTGRGSCKLGLQSWAQKRQSRRQAPSALLTRHASLPLRPLAGKWGHTTQDKSNWRHSTMTLSRKKVEPKKRAKKKMLDCPEQTTEGYGCPKSGGRTRRTLCALSQTCWFGFVWTMGADWITRA